MTLTPGAYLKHRRTAAGLSIADVAARLATEPRWPEHIRAEQLELIEADVLAPSFQTIVALRAVFRFDLTVLERLVAIHAGADLRAPRLCRICACSEHDACLDGQGGCSWVEQDLCTACLGPDLGARMTELHGAAAAAGISLMFPGAGA